MCIIDKKNTISYNSQFIPYIKWAPNAFPLYPEPVGGHLWDHPRLLNQRWKETIAEYLFDKMQFVYSMQYMRKMLWRQLPMHPLWKGTMAVILCPKLQNNYRLGNELWANEVLRDLSLRCVSGRYTILQHPHECYMSNRRARWAKLVRWLIIHDDVMKWKHFPRYWPLCGEFTCHRLIPLTKASDAKLWYSLICAWTNGWVNNRYADYLRRHRAHYDVTIMVM